jgi:hypothetical protein
MEYIAQFKTAEQYSPDDWKAVSPTLKVDDTTTIGQIREWMAKKRGAAEREFMVIIVDKI